MCGKVFFNKRNNTYFVTIGPSNMVYCTALCVVLINFLVGLKPKPTLTCHSWLYYFPILSITLICNNDLMSLNIRELVMRAYFISIF